MPSYMTTVLLQNDNTRVLVLEINILVQSIIGQSETVTALVYPIAFIVIIENRFMQCSKYTGGQMLPRPDLSYNKVSKIVID